MQNVGIKGQSFEVNQGSFEQEIALENGSNNIPVEVSNGLATTTISIRVLKLP